MRSGNCPNSKAFVQAIGARKVAPSLWKPIGWPPRLPPRCFPTSKRLQTSWPKVGCRPGFGASERASRSSPWGFAGFWSPSSSPVPQIPDASLWMLRDESASVPQMPDASCDMLRHEVSSVPQTPDASFWMTRDEPADTLQQEEDKWAFDYQPPGAST
eukprot:CAMPEP_0170607226 /NCGR_PEP_ID=MMETSP0224-20130122/20940_1 /TAXON_ID=285029 /ORGANISM="Togula jolla, Strain CCCM 725" /LENGTH=157 /DNA_ID=CAMNT_0010932375 /DNA_START=509 /DNA_END=982 /DNA_ORIENTATION=-